MQRIKLLSVLFAIILASPSVSAEIFHSDFETYSKSNYAGSTALGWKSNKAVLKAVKDKDVCIHPADNPDDPDVLIPETAVLKISTGRYLQYKGKGGIKWLDINFSATYNANLTIFQVEIEHDGVTDVLFKYRAAAQTNSVFEPIAMFQHIPIDGVTGDYIIKVTNTGEQSISQDMLFWDFSWEDCADDNNYDSDDLLWWSQQSGNYLCGTKIMVRGRVGTSLTLYNDGTEVKYAEAREGEIPVIVYGLDMHDTLYKLEAENAEVSSVHTFRTSDSGQQPVLALSHPQGCYNPGTEIIATGMVGQNMTISSSGSQSGEFDPVECYTDQSAAACESYLLPGDTGEFITVTLSSGEADPVGAQYYISRLWVPEDASMALDFQEAGQLYDGGVLLDISEADISGKTISNSASGTLWIHFDNATLMQNELSGKHYISIPEGAGITIGTDYVPGQYEIELKSLVIIQTEHQECLQPGNYTKTDEGFHSHSWTKGAKAPVAMAVSTISNSVQFTAQAPVSLLGFETRQQVVTGVEGIHPDMAPSRYFDLQGRPLDTPPTAGRYIELRQGKATVR